MDGELMWKSCDLSARFFDKLSGSYKMEIDGKTRRFTLESASFHKTKFYVGLVPLSLALISCVLRAIGPTPVNENPIQIFIIAFGEAVVIILCMNAGIVVTFYGEDLVEFMNHSFVLLEDYKNTFQHQIQANEKVIGLLYTKELLNILRGRHADYLGIIIVTIQLVIMANTFTFAVAMTSNLDPMFAITERLFSDSDPKIKIAFRLIFNQWAALQAIRPMFLCITCSLSYVGATKTVFTAITKQKLSRRSFLVYSCLQLNTSVGHDAIQHLAGAYMTGGFFLLVVLNYVVITCFDSVPLVGYVFVSFLAAGVYLTVHILLPQIVDFIEMSKHLLSSVWRLEFIRLRRAMFRKEEAIFRKTLRAQRPIKYYYGTAVFDQETKCNYYRNILEYTINLLLLQ